MRRFAFAVLFSCVFASFGVVAGPAQAGGYYDSGYYGGYSGGYSGYYHRHRSVYYTSRCCYRKVIRHERSAHFERIERPYYRDGYYGRSYRSSYYASPRYTDYSYGHRYRDYAYSHRYRDYGVRRYGDYGYYGR